MQGIEGLHDDGKALHGSLLDRPRKVKKIDPGKELFQSVRRFDHPDVVEKPLKPAPLNYPPALDFQKLA